MRRVLRSDPRYVLDLGLLDGLRCPSPGTAAFYTPAAGPVGGKRVAVKGPSYGGGDRALVLLLMHVEALAAQHQHGVFSRPVVRGRCQLAPYPDPHVAGDAETRVDRDPGDHSG